MNPSLASTSDPIASPTWTARRRAAVDDRRCPVLDAWGIVKSYRRGVWPHRTRLAVLGGVELSLCAGEMVGLVGENGSGKSTLMKICELVDVPQAYAERSVRNKRWCWR